MANPDVYQLYIKFQEGSDIPEYKHFEDINPFTTFYIKAPDDIQKRSIPLILRDEFDQMGNTSVSRTINKNLMQSQLPVKSYTEGGLCVDIGMTDDTFTIDTEIYSFELYRYLASLIKNNVGLKSGELVFQSDTFNVVVRNATFSFVSGKGPYFKLNLTLTVVNSRFTK